MDSKFTEKIKIWEINDGKAQKGHQGVETTLISDVIHICTMMPYERMTTKTRLKSLLLKSIIKKGISKM